jgi:hypothetical protein
MVNTPDNFLLVTYFSKKIFLRQVPEFMKRLCKKVEVLSNKHLNRS